LVVEDFYFPFSLASSEHSEHGRQETLGESFISAVEAVGDWNPASSRVWTTGIVAAGVDAPLDASVWSGR